MERQLLSVARLGLSNLSGCGVGGIVETNGLRYHVMLAQWSYCVWNVAHVLPVGAEPPTASSVEHQCTVGVNRDPRATS